MVDKLCGILSVFFALLVSLNFIFDSLNFPFVLIAMLTILSIIIGIFSMLAERKNIIVWIGIVMDILNISYVALLFFS
ncbi:hypothetical protein KZR98_002905, partial [Enterococcus faecalis]|nr:hypothetical protein [Enterococcus faecalis]